MFINDNKKEQPLQQVHFFCHLMVNILKLENLLNNESIKNDFCYKSTGK